MSAKGKRITRICRRVNTSLHLTTTFPPPPPPPKSAHYNAQINMQRLGARVNSFRQASCSEVPCSMGSSKRARNRRYAISSGSPRLIKRSILLLSAQPKREKGGGGGGGGRQKKKKKKKKKKADAHRPTDTQVRSDHHTTTTTDFPLCLTHLFNFFKSRSRETRRFTLRIVC